MAEFARIVRFLARDAGRRVRDTAHPADLTSTIVADAVVRAVDLPGGREPRRSSSAGPEVVTWNELWAAARRRAREAPAPVHLPIGSRARCRQHCSSGCRRPPVTRDQLTMLEAGDNVCDPSEAVRTFGARAHPARRAAPPLALAADGCSSAAAGTRIGARRRGAGTCPRRSRARPAPEGEGRLPGPVVGNSPGFRRSAPCPLRWLGDSP